MFFIDGFDLYSNAGELTRRWDYANPGTFNTSGGRFDGRFPSNTGNFDDIAFAKSLLEGGDVISNKYCASGAFRFATPDSGNTDLAMIAFGPALRTTPATIPQTHIKVALWNGGALRLFCGTTVLATSAAGIIVANAFQRLECEVYLHSTSGTVRVHVDGTQIFNFTGNTINAALADPKIRAVMFGRYGASDVGASAWDDFAVWSTGSRAYPLGDFAVNTLLPDSDGTTVNGTPLAGAAFAAVDDLGGGDNDATYITDAAINNVNLFNAQSLTLGGSVLAVAVNSLQRAAAPGLRAVKLGVRSGAANFFGAVQNVPAQLAYVHRQEVFVVNPNGGAAWLPADIDALQIGYIVES